MAHIVEFTVDGLAGRSEPYACKLNRHVNIFFGLNGSGKTSLLRILNAAMEHDSEALRTVPFKRAVVKIHSVLYDQVYTYEVEQPGEVAVAVNGGVEQPRKNPRTSEIQWRVTPERDKKKGAWAHLFLPIHRMYVPIGAKRISSSVTEATSDDELGEVFAASVTAIWNVYTARLASSIRKTQEKGLASILRTVLTQSGQRSEQQSISSAQAYDLVSSFLSRQPGLVHVLTSLDEFTKRYEEDRQLKSIVLDINEVERTVDAETEPRREVETLIRDLFNNGKTITFDEPSLQLELADHRKIGLPRLSSGEKQLLHILIHTLLVAESAILIDEPELSMHVDWQKRLVASMRKLNANAQIIMATHSPEIMADVSDDEVFRL